MTNVIVNVTLSNKTVNKFETIMFVHYSTVFAIFAVLSNIVMNSTLHTTHAESLICSKGNKKSHTTHPG